MSNFIFDAAVMAVFLALVLGAGYVAQVLFGSKV